MQTTSQPSHTIRTVPFIDHRSGYINMQQISKPLEHFPKKAAMPLGLLQVICGCLCIIFNSVGIALQAHLSLLSHGIWCGTLFVVTGVFGMLAGSTQMSFHIVAFMVLSITSASLCPYILVMAAVGLDEDKYCSRENEDGDREDCSASFHGAVQAMNAMLIVMSVVEATLAIISAVVCSRAYCCYRTTAATRNRSGQQIEIIYAGASSSNTGAVVLDPEFHNPQRSSPIGVTNYSKHNEAVEPPSYDQLPENLKSDITPL